MFWLMLVDCFRLVRVRRPADSVGAQQQARQEAAAVRRAVGLQHDLDGRGQNPKDRPAET